MWRRVANCFGRWRELNLTPHNVLRYIVECFLENPSGGSTMFHQLYNRESTAEHHFASPLVDERLRYLRHCAEQGCTRGTLRGTASMLLTLIKKLGLRNKREISIEEIRTAGKRWASRKPRHSSIKHGLRSERQFTSVAVNWLRFIGRLREPVPPANPNAGLVADFADYLSREKGLAAETVKLQCWYVTDFLNRLHSSNRRLKDLSISDINEAVALKGNQDGYTRRSLRCVAEVLRSFFRYAEAQDLCSRGLSLSIKAPRIYQNEGIPTVLTWYDVQRLLALTDSDHPTDIRDRAILLLFMSYGLRSAELRRLRLEDIDWERETILVRHSKQQQRQQVYPLSTQVGEALLRYLREVRLRSSYRELFLTMISPIQPISGTCLWNIVGWRLRKLGISLKHIGPHVLRHACATHLLAEGLSMKAIADHLGHLSPKATSIYAKVDLNGLRQVAEFDLGGLSKKAIADYLGDLSPKATSIHAKADLNRLRQVAEFDLGGLS